MFVMTEQTRADLFPNFEIPNDPVEAARTLEDRFLGDLEFLESNPPDPLAPVGERIAYTLAVGRARADAETIRALRESSGEEYAVK